MPELVLTDAAQQEIRSNLEKVTSIIATLKGRFREIDPAVQRLGNDQDKMSGEITALRQRAMPIAPAFAGQARGVVSEGCAKHLGCLVVIEAEKLGCLKELSSTVRGNLMHAVATILGPVELRAGLSASDIPIPALYPIRWVECLPVNSTTPTASAVAAIFGDATFQYLGTRSEIRLETSNEVYFATDELAIRALERFCVNLMNDNALAVLQLAAA